MIITIISSVIYKRYGEHMPFLLFHFEQERQVRQVRISLHIKLEFNFNSLHSVIALMDTTCVTCNAILFTLFTLIVKEVLVFRRHIMSCPLYRVIMSYFLKKKKFDKIANWVYTISLI